MSREVRGEVLAALREVHDGRWVRLVGTDGGRALDWEGRLTIVGAVTTAWDAAHTVVSAMGDRFVLCRLDSTTQRVSAGRRAIANTGSEDKMRSELATAVSDVLAGVGDTRPALSHHETETLLRAADLVTLSRTAVERDFRGDVTNAHAPEVPTRFAKQLTQVVRGGVAIGLSHERALRLAIRCARDSMPPMRLAVIDYLAAHPKSFTADVRRGIDKPHSTVDRELQALHMLGVLGCEEVDVGKPNPRWSYSLHEHIDPIALVPEMSVLPNPTVRKGDFDHGYA